MTTHLQPEFSILIWLYVVIPRFGLLSGVVSCLIFPNLLNPNISPARPNKTSCAACFILSAGPRPHEKGGISPPLRDTNRQGCSARIHVITYPYYPISITQNRIIRGKQKRCESRQELRSHLLPIDRSPPTPPKSAETGPGIPTREGKKGTPRREASSR